MLAPLGTMARPRAPESSSTSTSTVGLPRESSTSRPTTSTIVLMLLPATASSGPVATVADVTSEPKPFNPFEPGFAEDPYPQYAELCASNPVQRTPFGPWMLFRYDDSVRFLRDPTLSVEDRSVIGANPRAELREQILGDRPQRGTRSILNIDPPDHTRIRGIVQKVFTPETIERLTPTGPGARRRDARRRGGAGQDGGPEST